MFKGEFIKKSRDRAYTHDEIKKILDVSDLRMKIVILLMASTGCRVGALPALRLRNLEKIDSHNLYKMTFYEGSNESYYSYTTPETASFIDAYLQFREKNGEKLNPDNYLIRDQFDITDLEQIRNKSKGVSIYTFHGIVDNALLKAGLKTRDHTSQHIRKEIMKCHGFRKFFTNQLIEADLKTELRWLLEGHTLKGQDTSYVRISEKRLLEEYIKAINFLTINEENRLKMQVQALQGENSQVERDKEVTRLQQRDEQREKELKKILRTLRD